MRYPSILLWCALVLVGCGESAAEKQARQAEEQETRRQVALAMPTDRMSLYLINQAENRCKTHPVHECNDIATLRQDIADAVASCAGNTSHLCQLMAYPVQHQPEDFAQLPQGIGNPLPSSPFYWGLGNPVLDRYATQTGYRAEVSKQWLQANRQPLWAVLAALLTLLLVYAGKLLHTAHQAHKREALKCQQQAEEQADKEALARKQAEEQAAAQQAEQAEAQRLAHERQRREQAQWEADQIAAAEAKAEQKRLEAEEQAEMDELAAMFRDAFKGVK